MYCSECVTREPPNAKHKLLDNALRQSQERLTLATESARIGIWDWDLVANKLIWDARMYELYGIREQDFSGAYDAWQAGLHPEDRCPRRCRNRRCNRWRQGLQYRISRRMAQWRGA